MEELLKYVDEKTNAILLPFEEIAEILNIKYDNEKDIINQMKQLKTDDGKCAFAFFTALGCTHAIISPYYVPNRRIEKIFVFYCLY